ncbi:RDD family protein [Candidatus Woesearchaeota archaeon]|nr:RDD family protein [Candidatus Woesearchaeota archaeon]
MAKKKWLGLPEQSFYAGPAGFVKRFLAFIIDLSIINLTVLFPFRRIIGNIMPGAGTFQESLARILSNEGLQGSILIVSTAISVFVLLYFAVLEFKLQTTPGKYFFRLFVASDGKKLTFMQAAGRSMFFLPIFPFFLLGIADPLMMIFHKGNRRLSEILTKTRTVEYYAYSQSMPMDSNLRQ